ncbi:MAG: DNA repair protein RadC [Lachnospiraceae bacterium]|nr:DNA repair protein RadC [Lachnospiraceae bacterium]MCI9573522.1 DNA repair protein RadC [Lachnospiraceae bacterium]
MAPKTSKAQKNALKTASELPYERFKRFGPENLTEIELLAIILRTGTKDNHVLQVAEEVMSLARYPKEGLLGLYDVTLEELMSIRGIGEVKAVRLKCLTELSMRMSMAKAREGLNLTSSGQVAAYFMEKLRHRETECVVVACVDAKGQLICERKLSEGSVNMSLISPREIFLAALESRAVNIVLVHNHPSGDPTPSLADRVLTGNVRETGERMGIRLLDHVIIGDNCYVSFKERAWFSEEPLFPEAEPV